MRTLAIDYGAKRIGLALSDERGRLALPLGVIRRGKDFLLELRKIIAERAVERIVLGHPLRLDGEAGDAARKMAEFAEELRRAFSLPVLLHNEALTSDEAEAELRAMGVKPQRRKELRDAVAAALILRSFLEEENR